MATLPLKNLVFSGDANTYEVDDETARQATSDLDASLAPVAKSGLYSDLTGKPTIPGIATTSTAGVVQPDGTTITVDSSGKISSVAKSTGSATYNASTSTITITF